MKTIVRVTETDFDEELGFVIETVKHFEGKNRDADLQKFLESLHFTKMNQACVDAGIGPYAMGKLTVPSKYSRVPTIRDETPAYHKVQQQIRSKLHIVITHQS